MPAHIRKCSYESYLNFKYGAVLSGCFQVFASTVTIVMIALTLSYHDEIIATGVRLFPQANMLQKTNAMDHDAALPKSRTEMLLRELLTPTMSIFFYVLAVINILFSATLLVGISKRIAAFFQPWLVFHGVIIGILLHLILIAFAFTVMTNVFLCLIVSVIMVLAFVFEMKVLYAVWAFYEIINDIQHSGHDDNPDDCEDVRNDKFKRYLAFGKDVSL